MPEVRSAPEPEPLPELTEFNLPALAPADPPAAPKGDPAAADSVPAPGGGEPARRERPGFVFLGVVAATCLLADALAKAWAEVELTRRSALEPLVLIEQHLSFALAYNRGGAWGLLQNASETVRRPFFLCVSVAAIAFIVSLYGKLHTGQRALRWGLPLVLGGALGNLADRVTRGSVVDFIDYRAGWVEAMNRGIAALVSGWHVTDHWPTFNVADIAICTGVALMALDMFLSNRRSHLEHRRDGQRSSSAPHPVR
jgi:signal peptidase II